MATGRQRRITRSQARHFMFIRFARNAGGLYDPVVAALGHGRSQHSLHDPRHSRAGAQMTLVGTLGRIPVTGYQAAALAIVLWLLS